MKTTCKHALFTRIGASAADVWNTIEKNESGKRDKRKRGEATFIRLHRLGSMAEMEQAKKECGRGSAAWALRGDPGRGTVISGRRAGGGIVSGRPER